MWQQGNEGAVFVQTNEPQNRVVAFHRAADGALTRRGAYVTGGAGDGEPHLPSQGSVVLTGDGRYLLVTNVASDSVSAFAVGPDGGLELIGATPAGTAPKSVAEHDGLVYVLSTATASVLGYRLSDAGPERIPDAEHELSSPDADPAQVGFDQDGSVVVVTERGTDSITTFAVVSNGTLDGPHVVASSGPTPYGFAFSSIGILVVTEAFGAQVGAAAASSYVLNGTALTPVTKSVPNGRSEICWAVVTNDGRYAFTTNFADGAVSRFAIEADGTLNLGDPTAGISVDGRPGLRDEALSADGRYLYCLDADAGAVRGWAVGAGGVLEPVGSWNGLPATVAGLAAR